MRRPYGDDVAQLDDSMVLLALALPRFLCQCVTPLINEFILTVFLQSSHF